MDSSSSSPRNAGLGPGGAFLWNPKLGGAGDHDRHAAAGTGDFSPGLSDDEAGDYRAIATFSHNARVGEGRFMAQVVERDRGNKALCVALTIIGIVGLITAAGFAIHGGVEKFTDTHWMVVGGAGGGGVVLFVIGLIGIKTQRSTHDADDHSRDKMGSARADTDGSNSSDAERTVRFNGGARGGKRDGPTHGKRLFLDLGVPADGRGGGGGGGNRSLSSTQRLAHDPDAHGGGQDEPAGAASGGPGGSLSGRGHGLVMGWGSGRHVGRFHGSGLLSGSDALADGRGGGSWVDGGRSPSSTRGSAHDADGEGEDESAGADANGPDSPLSGPAYGLMIGGGDGHDSRAHGSRLLSGSDAPGGGDGRGRRVDRSRPPLSALRATYNANGHGGGWRVDGRRSPSLSPPRPPRIDVPVSDGEGGAQRVDGHGRASVHRDNAGYKPYSPQGTGPVSSTESGRFSAGVGVDSASRRLGVLDGSLRIASAGGGAVAAAGK